MKTVLLLVLSVAVVMSASASFAQGVDAIMLYSDNITFADCNLVDGAPGILNVYAVHAFVVGATAAQFAITESHTMAYVAWTANHQVAVGNDPRIGVAVTYDLGCEAGPILVGWIAYFAAGSSPVCSNITVVPDPIAASGRIEGVDCFFVSTFPNASVLTINGDVTCTCGEQTPTEETSWGRVKALYN